MGLGVIRHKIWYDLWENRGRTMRVVAIIAVGAFAVGLIIGARELISIDADRTWLNTNPATIGLTVDPPVSDTTIDALENLRGIDEVEGWYQARIEWRAGPDEPWRAAILTARDDYEEQKLRRLVLDEGAWPERRNIAIQRGYGVEVGTNIELNVKDKVHAADITGIAYNAAHPPPLRLTRCDVLHHPRAV